MEWNVEKKHTNIGKTDTKKKKKKKLGELKVKKEYINNSNYIITDYRHKDSMHRGEEERKRQNVTNRHRSISFIITNIPQK